jgi:hypothetical protein
MKTSAPVKTKPVLYGVNGEKIVMREMIQR